MPHRGEFTRYEPNRAFDTASLESDEEVISFDELPGVDMLADDWEPIFEIARQLDRSKASRLGLNIYDFSSALQELKLGPNACWRSVCAFLGTQFSKYPNSSWTQLARALKDTWEANQQTLVRNRVLSELWLKYRTYKLTQVLRKWREASSNYVIALAKCYTFENEQILLPKLQQWRTKCHQVRSFDSTARIFDKLRTFRRMNSVTLRVQKLNKAAEIYRHLKSWNLLLQAATSAASAIRLMNEKVDNRLMSTVLTKWRCMTLLESTDAKTKTRSFELFVNVKSQVTTQTQMSDQFAARAIMVRGFGSMKRAVARVYQCEERADARYLHLCRTKGLHCLLIEARLLLQRKNMQKRWLSRMRESVPRVPRSDLACLVSKYFGFWRLVTRERLAYAEKTLALVDHCLRVWRLRAQSELFLQGSEFALEKRVFVHWRAAAHQTIRARMITESRALVVDRDRCLARMFPKLLSQFHSLQIAQTGYHTYSTSNSFQALALIMEKATALQQLATQHDRTRLFAVMRRVASRQMLTLISTEFAMEREIKVKSALWEQLTELCSFTQDQEYQAVCAYVGLILRNWRAIAKAASTYLEPDILKKPRLEHGISQLKAVSSYISIINAKADEEVAYRNVLRRKKIMRQWRIEQRRYQDYDEEAKVFYHRRLRTIETRVFQAMKRATPNSPSSSATPVQMQTPGRTAVRFPPSALRMLQLRNQDRPRSSPLLRRIETPTKPNRRLFDTSPRPDTS